MERVQDQMGGGDEDAGRLPDHEYREDNTVGGGVMSSGGTAIERGTTQSTASDEDSTAEPGEVTADREAQDAYDPVATPADLFGGRADNDGIDDVDDLDEGKLQGQARPQL